MAQGECKRTTELIEQAKAILAEVSPMTILELLYRLVSVETIENNRGDYQRVSTAMTKARNDGRIDFGAIVDRSRPEYMRAVFDDAAQYARVVSRGYRKDYWQLQPIRVEVWSPNELRQRIRVTVETCIDMGLWERAVAVEKVGLASIVDTVNRWPGVRTGGPKSCT